MKKQLFTTFNPIINSLDESKKDLLDYYNNNNITPSNEYVERYIESAKDNTEIKETPELSLNFPVSFQKSDLPNILSLNNNSSSNVKLNSTSNSKNEEKQKALKTINFFKNLGLTKEQSAGIAGNFHAESGFNTDALGDRGTSFGIAQWHKDRWDKLKEFAKERGVSENEFDTQLSFAWHELQTTENKALRALMKTKTTKDAAKVFSDHYERPKKYNQARELKAHEYSLY